MKVNDVLEVEIIGYDHEGIGVAKIDGFPIFVKKAMVGEIVSCRITRLNNKLAEASLLKVIKSSLNRNQNPCCYSNVCGGCNIHHMCYNEQLKFKKQMVIDTLYKIGGIETTVHDVVPNPNVFHYRNKIIVPFGIRNNKVVSGFFEPKSHMIVPQDSCLIEHKESRNIINYIKELAIRNKIEIYDEKNHSGLLRNVMLRVNDNDEFMLVIIVTKDTKIVRDLVLNVYNYFDNIKSAYLNVNPNKTNVILNSNGFIHVIGTSVIIENINGLKYEVHPNSFLQINHDQTERLYNKVLEYIDDDKSQIIIDAYCGIGSITLNLAKKAKEVYGIEIVEEAVVNANRNKILNNISNVTFICGKCEEEIQNLTKLTNVDTIIFDPPRKGCDIEFLKTVVDMNVKRIVYVSCGPASLARDCKYLIENGYTIEEITPFDLFSHSSHVECVCTLSLSKK